MPTLSQKAIRDVVQKGPINKKKLRAALEAAEVSIPNDALLDGYLEQGLEKWMTLDDKGLYSIRQRASTGGGAPTKLYKLDDPANPVGAKIVEQEYDAKAEEKDPLLKRTPLAAVKRAKAAWYNDTMVPQREAFRALEAEHAPKKEEAAAAEA